MIAALLTRGNAGAHKVRQPADDKAVGNGTDHQAGIAEIEVPLAEQDRPETGMSVIT